MVDFKTRALVAQVGCPLFYKFNILCTTFDRFFLILLKEIVSYALSKQTSNRFDGYIVEQLLFNLAKTSLGDW